MKEVDKKEEKEKIIEKNDEFNRNLKTLTLLIILLVIVDFVAYIVIYQPKIDFNFKEVFKSKENQGITSKPIVSIQNKSSCIDGTPFNSCSKNKPYFCYEGELVKKASICGCPEGKNINFQDCV